MKYEKAVVEVVPFDNSDVITASGCNVGFNSKKPCDGPGFEFIGGNCPIASHLDPGEPEGPGEM